MPGGDGRGPMGLGPMTGRGAGFCAGYPYPGYMNAIPGRGRGRGFGRGFGRSFGRGFGWGRDNSWGHPYYAYPQNYPYQQNIDSASEAEMLKTEAEYLKEEMKAINDRIKDLESAQKSKSKDDK